MSIDFACPSCKKKYRVKDELAGKSAKCSKCDGRFKVPSPAAELSPLDDLTSDQLTSDGDLGDWFDDELSATKPMSSAASGSTSSASQSRKSTSRKCSACGNSLATGAVICVACGFDTRSGKKHETKKGVEDDSPASKGKAVATQTASLARGAVFSAIGAVVGAAVWVGVAIAADVQLGWIAWGLGFAAGVGMAFGHEDDDGTMAGIVAAGISILGILGAKFYLFQHWKSNPFGEDDFDGLGDQAEAFKDAMAQVFEQHLTFADMFGPIDGLFILLAVASAYKFGSGQMID